MNDLDYERWRGAVDEKLWSLKAGQDQLPGHIDRWGDRVEAALLRHVEDDQKVEDEHNRRIGALETKQSRLLGQLAIFGAITLPLLSAAAAFAARWLVP